MAELIARRKPATLDRYLVAAERCGGCHGCAAPISLELVLIDASTDQVSLSLSASSQCMLFVNAWFKPLVAVVGVSMLCSSNAVNEPITVCLSVLAFGLGLRMCRRVPGTVVRQMGRPD